VVGVLDVVPRVVMLFSSVDTKKQLVCQRSTETRVMLAVELHDSTATGSIKLMIVLRYSSRFRSTAS